MRIQKTGVLRDDENGNEYTLKRWVDQYYDHRGNLVKTITSEGDYTIRKYDKNNKLISLKSSDNNTIMCSKEHFKLKRKR